MISGGALRERRRPESFMKWIAILFGDGGMLADRQYGKIAQAGTAGMEAESTKTTIWRHDTKAGAGDIGYTVTAQTEKEEIP